MIEHPTEDMKTFIHKFSKTCWCRCEVEDAPPEPGTVHDRQIFWQGQPKRRHLGQYIQWQHEINSTLADSWNQRIMHCFRIQKTPPRWQFWAYEPGQPPRLVRIGSEPAEPCSETTHLGVFDTEENE